MNDSATVPDPAQPNSMQPDSMQPDSAQPDSAQPGSAQPGSVQPGLAQPAPAGAGGVGWWRRNRVPLLAFGILAVLTPIVIMGPTLRKRRQDNPTDPIVVEVGNTAAYGTATVGPASAAFDNDVDAPPGVQVVRVSVEISDAASLVCRTPSLRETTGARRRFTSLSAFVQSPDQSTFDACDPTQGPAYELTLTYLVPEDAAGPFAVEVESSDLLPKYVQLKVQP